MACPGVFFFFFFFKEKKKGILGYGVAGQGRAGGKREYNRTGAREAIERGGGLMKKREGKGREGEGREGYEGKGRGLVTMCCILSVERFDCCRAG